VSQVSQNVTYVTVRAIKSDPRMCVGGKDCSHFARIVEHKKEFQTNKMVRNILLTAALLSTAAAFAPLPVVNQQRVSTPLNLAVGETAPDFSLEDQNGKTFKRSAIKKPLVIFFYPADSSPGCTKQATAFNEEVKDLKKKFGATVVGISGQDVASKQKFASELSLSYSILADTGDAVRKSFAVPKALFVLPGRVTYVLDKDGVCQSVYNELGNAESHVSVAAQALVEMTPESKNPFASIFGN
jgi:peroxiredoxin Q/BCP